MITNTTLRRAVGASVAAITLTCPAASLAAGTVTLSSAGRMADVAVSADGAGHVAFDEPHSGAPDVVRTCTLAPGATGCTPAGLTPATGTSNDFDPARPYVFLPDATHELLFDGRCCPAAGGLQKILYSSSDAGASFGAPTTVASDTGTGDGMAGQAVYVPAGSVAGVTADQLITINGAQSAGSDIQAAPVAGPAATAHFSISTGAATVNPGLASGLGLLEATYMDLGSAPALHSRTYSGSGDLNADGSWKAAQTVDGVVDTGRASNLAGGPSGIFVLYATVVGGQHVYVVRSRQSSGWSAPTTVTDADPSSSAFLSEDPAGGLHLVWQDGQGNLHYRYTTDPAASVWSSPQTLGAQRPGGYQHLRVATDSGGDGWVVWDSGTTGVVQAMALAPGAPLPTPAPTPPPPTPQNAPEPPLAGAAVAQLRGTFAPAARTTACGGGGDLQSVTTYPVIVARDEEVSPALGSVTGDPHSIALGAFSAISAVKAADGTILDDTFSPWDPDRVRHLDGGWATGDNDVTLDYGPAGSQGALSSLPGSVSTLAIGYGPRGRFPLGATLQGHAIDTTGPFFDYVYALSFDTRRGWCEAANSVTITRRASTLVAGVTTVTKAAVATYAGCPDGCRTLLALRAGGQTIASRRVTLPAHAFRQERLTIKRSVRPRLSLRRSLPASLVTTTTFHGRSHTSRTPVRLRLTSGSG